MPWLFERGTSALILVLEKHHEAYKERRPLNVW